MQSIIDIYEYLDELNDRYSTEIAYLEEDDYHDIVQKQKLQAKLELIDKLMCYIERNFDIEE